MRLKETILGILSCAFLLFSPLKAQSLNEQIYDSYIKGDMLKWEAVMGEMERAWQHTKNYDLLFDFTIAQYGYIAFCLTQDDKDLAREIVEEAFNNANLMIKRDPNWTQAHALLGAIYGFKVGMNPLRVYAYATKSSEENKIALSLAPNNPNVWMEKGNYELYKPAVFGGSKKDAIGNYKKSVALFETNKSELEYNWLYLNTLNGLAKAYIKTGNFKQADFTYKKILRVEPNISWIKERDYPKFLEKYGEQRQIE
ncbi:MAG: hypothetical protein PF450_05625 [Bacteroidales bacterium]|nr:hypothetical protein [Bacteroidales bacterium]